MTTPLDMTRQPGVFDNSKFDKPRVGQPFPCGNITGCVVGIFSYFQNIFNSSNKIAIEEPSTELELLRVKKFDGAPKVRLAFEPSSSGVDTKKPSKKLELLRLKKFDLSPEAPVAFSPSSVGLENTLASKRNAMVDTQNLRRRNRSKTLEDVNKPTLPHVPLDLDTRERAHSDDVQGSSRDEEDLSEAGWSVVGSRKKRFSKTKESSKGKASSKGKTFSKGESLAWLNSKFERTYH
ncbi:MAG: hypothetical protein ACI9S8_001796 [Chlamydiales bacterium]|jgi:hypothetical protein